MECLWEWEEPPLYPPNITSDAGLKAFVPNCPRPSFFLCRNIPSNRSIVSGSHTPSRFDETNTIWSKSIDIEMSNLLSRGLKAPCEYLLSYRFQNCVVLRH